MTRLRNYFMRTNYRETIMMNRKFRNMSMLYIYKLINVLVIYTHILSL